MSAVLHSYFLPQVRIGKSSQSRYLEKSTEFVCSCLDPHTQQRMLEQLNRLAIYQRRYSQKKLHSGIGYEWLWKRALRFHAVSEDITFSSKAPD